MEQREYTAFHLNTSFFLSINFCQDEFIWIEKINQLYFISMYFSLISVKINSLLGYKNYNLIIRILPHNLKALSVVIIYSARPLFFLHSSFSHYSPAGSVFFSMWSMLISVLISLYQFKQTSCNKGETGLLTRCKSFLNSISFT